PIIQSMAANKAHPTRDASALFWRAATAAAVPDADAGADNEEKPSPPLRKPSDSKIHQTKAAGLAPLLNRSANKPDYYRWLRPPCVCNMSIHLPDNLTGQVFAYYALTNFYQNHRRYVKSPRRQPAAGWKPGSEEPLQDCSPYRQDPGSGSWILPCGAIANSLFKRHLPAVLPFANRRGRLGRDEELIVWMRTAALPSFRKLHRIVLHNASSAADWFKDGLPSGNYTLLVNYALSGERFSGTKSFVLTTSSWSGGRNPALGIIYMLWLPAHRSRRLFVVIHIQASKK
uniref:Exostosin domain-containing protein n=1 Tax=Macrostomum lignano TaxID=282301 RepID=A0A1I8F715_9PLAT